MTPSRQQKQKNLSRLLRPRHIAFIGSAQAAGSLAACQQAGYEGQIWTVNPRREQIGGVRCVQSISQLPEPPDAALLALSPARTVNAVRELAAMGAGGAVCMAAGFAELGGDGVAMQTALIEAAGDLAVLGPNCMGMLNQFDGAAVWGSSNHMERCHGDGAAFISQSGALLFGMSNVEQVFPMGYGISTGNQAIIDAADCIQAVLDDKRIRAIGLYLEGLEDGNALGEACQQALDQGVPIVVLKGGDTPAGETVALSHTGAMVVERDMWDAFAQRYGLIEVSSPKALVETLKLLVVGGLPKGRRVSVITFSGGLNGLTAARAPKFGLELAPPTPENAARLRERMPLGVPIANPLDLNLPWSSKTGLSMQDGQIVAEGIVELARDSADMAIFFADVPRQDEQRLDADWLPCIEGMGHVRKTLNIPCIVSGIVPEGLPIDLRQRLLAMGVAPLLGYSEALEAMSVAAQLAEIHAAKRAEATPRPLLTGEQGGSPQMLDEAMSKTLLRPFGLQMPNSWAGSANEAAAAAEQLGFPVVVKVLSTEIAHKAQVGGVKLGLNSAEAVTQAVTEIQAAVVGAGFSAETLLVERMIAQPIAEYIIGVKRHPALGLALMIGRGGTSVESINQYATMLLPIENSALDAALDQIGVYAGSHGRDALRKAALSIATFATETHETLVTLDVNPVIVTATGDAIAADALIVTTANPVN
ncbi:MAG: acetate--CoA ligase family protein [Candidatus Promineifilaceae bacterium]